MLKILLVSLLVCWGKSATTEFKIVRREYISSEIQICYISRQPTAQKPLAGEAEDRDKKPAHVDYPEEDDHTSNFQECNSIIALDEALEDFPNFRTNQSSELTENQALSHRNKSNDAEIAFEENRNYARSLIFGCLRPECLFCPQTDQPDCGVCSTNGLNPPGCCDPGDVYDGSECITCESNQYASTSSCEDCRAECATCSDAGDCNTCLDSSKTLPGCCSTGQPYSGTACLTCNGNQYPTSNTCEDCRSECASCSDGIDCGSCTDNNTSTPGCCASNQYYDGTVCVDCSNDEYSTGTSCEPCRDPCSLCSSSTDCDSCDSADNSTPGCCNSNQYYDNNVCVTCLGNTYPSGTSCVECRTECATCTSPTDCVTCADNSNVLPGCCPDSLGYNGSVCVTCNPNQYFSSGNCVDCRTECASCSSASDCDTCLDEDNSTPGCCNSNQFYSDGVCTDCRTECASCSSTTDCATCSDENNSTPGCCPSNSYYDDSVCVACSSDQYVSGTSCEDCRTECATCSSATDCDSCSDSLASTPGCCPSNSYYDSAVCIACNGDQYVSGTSCGDCRTECASCSSDTDCDSCDDVSAATPGCCPANSYYNASVCVSCSSTQFVVGTSCVDCRDECGTCSSTADCDSCASSGSIPGCCASDQYYSNGACEDCRTECASCSTGTDCQTCVDVASTVPGCCIGTDIYTGSVCSNCPVKQFLNGSLCEDCRSECASCISATDCVTCEDIQASVPGCCASDQYYSSGICNNCLTGCNTCTDGNSCDTCVGKHYMTTQSVCASCSDSLCQACPGNSCSTCVNNASPIDGTCQCDSGYYQSGTECYKLCDLCKSCNANFVCECIEYAAPVQGETNPNNLCACLNSQNIGGNECIPLGDYYTDNTNIDKIEFNSSYLELGVYFKTTPVFVDITDSSDCSEYFKTATISAFGDSPTCVQTDDKIIVTLGFGYTLRIGDTVNLFWLHIRKSSSQISTSHIDLSGIVTGGDFPTPIVAVVGPQSVYLSCAVASVDYSVTSISGLANNVVTYEWSISPNLPTPLSSEELSKLTLNIQTEAFGSTPADYTLSVSARNVFGNQGSASMVLSVSASSGLAVTLSTGSYLEIKSDETIDIEPIVEDKCGDSGGLSYLWTFEGTLSGNSVANSALIESSIKERLRIEAGSHAAGETYTYRSTVSSESNSGFSMLTLKVIYGEPVALMNIENGSITNLDNLVLDGSSSYDPSGEELTYLWTCEYSNSAVCVSPTGSELFSSENKNSVSFSVEASNLIIGSFLKITLTITTTDNRAASITKTLEVVDGGALSIQTVAISGKIVVHRQLSIQLAIENGASIVWTQTEGPVLGFSISTELPLLWIPRNTMTEGQDYTFQATVTDSIGHSIYVLVSWRTNKSPLCQGTLQALNEAGNILKIGISDCFDQDDIDVPLKYNFGFNWNDYELPTVYRTFSNFMTLWSLDGVKDYTVYVCDTIGSCSLYATTIGITQSRELTDTASIQSAFYSAKNQDKDLIPFVVLDISRAYDLTESDWVFLFNELSVYTLNLIETDSKLDENSVSGFIGVIAGLLTEYSAITSYYVIQGLDYVQTITTNADHRLSDLDIEMLIETFKNLVDHYMDDNQVLEKVLETQFQVNSLQMKQIPPGDTVFEFKSNDSKYVSSILRSTGDSIRSNFSFSIQLDSKTYVANITNIEDISIEDVIDLEIIVASSASSSDSFTFNLYKSGSFTKSTLQLTLDETRTLLEIKNLTDPISLTIPYSYNTSATYGAYVLTNEVWTYDKDIIVTNSSDSFTLYTKHASTFSIRELISTTTVVSSDDDCSFYYVPLLILLGSIVITAVLIILACLLQRKNHVIVPQVKDKSEVNDYQDTVREHDKEDFESSDAILSKFVYSHPIAGQLRHGPVPMIERVPVVSVSLLLNLLIVGVLMVAVENVEANKVEVDAENYLLYGFYSSLISFVMVLSIEFTFISPSHKMKLKRTFRWTLIIIFVVQSIVGISIITPAFCENWSKIWCIVFAFAVIVEWFVLHSIFALIRVCIRPKPRESRVSTVLYYK